MSTMIDEIYRRMNDDIEIPEIDLNDSKIREFFAGKTILLSGATGYVGQVFIEKILRDCPQIERLYVLIRERKGLSMEDTVKKYFSNAIFEKLQSIDPNFTSKVTVIIGDLEQDKLGISPSDRQTLTSKIDLIVHTGATTKFDEKISIALKINVLGTKHLLDLATDCKKIQAFIHVSTGYSHCYRKEIEEVFYESPADIERVYELIERDERKEFSEEEVKEIVGKWPNVYTFSKAVAEGLVKQYGDEVDFAVAVYRPTIIIAARKEPIPGWIGNSNGPTLLFIGTGLGIIHAAYHDNERYIDMIPVDFVTNSLIAVIYEVVQKWKIHKKPMVYNYGSSTTNPVCIKDIVRWFAVESPNIGSVNEIWHPFIIFTQSMVIFWILHVIFHFLPAVVADFARMCIGKKPRALKLFMMVTKNIDKMTYFGNGNWRIHTTRTMEVYDKLGKADQEIFNFDVRNLDWEVMIVMYLRGTRIWMLKESLDNLEVAKKRYQKMKKIHYTVASVVLMLIGYFVWRVFLSLYSCFVVG